MASPTAGGGWLAPSGDTNPDAGTAPGAARDAAAKVKADRLHARQHGQTARDGRPQLAGHVEHMADIAAGIGRYGGGLSTGSFVFELGQLRKPSHPGLRAWGRWRPWLSLLPPPFRTPVVCPGFGADLDHHRNALTSTGVCSRRMGGRSLDAVVPACLQPVGAPMPMSWC